MSAASGILGLPEELRHIIYEYAYLPHTHYRRSGALQIYHTLPPSLELVCRQMYAETSKIRIGPRRIQARDEVCYSTWRNFWEDFSCEYVAELAPNALPSIQRTELRVWHTALPIVWSPGFHTALLEVHAAYRCRSGKADRPENFSLLISGANGAPGSLDVQPLIRIRRHVRFMNWQVKNLVADTRNATKRYQDLVARLWMMTFKDCMDGGELIKSMGDKRAILHETLRILCDFDKSSRAGVLDCVRVTRAEDDAKLFEQYLDSIRNR